MAFCLAHYHTTGSIHFSAHIYAHMFTQGEESGETIDLQFKDDETTFEDLEVRLVVD